MPRSAALAAAKSAADLARREPTATNVRAVQQAIAAVTHVRADAVAPPQSALAKARSAAQRARSAPTEANITAARHAVDEATRSARADGHGYNPYRAKGKFARGPHKARAKSGREHVTASPPNAALTKAKAAAKAARANPTKANVAAAKHAVGEAAQAGKSPRAPKTKEQGIDRAARHAEAGEHAKASEVSKFVAHDQRRQLAAPEATGTPDGQHGRQLTPESQAALRGHLNETLAKYGMTDRDAGLPEAHHVEVRSDQAMAGAGGLHYTQTGKIALNHSTASALYEHGQHDPTELGKRFRAEDPDAQRMVGAYRLTAHEASHGHGPAVDYEKHGVMLEEMTTEMAARKVTADVHGLGVWDVRMVGSYSGYISSTVSALSDATGRSRQDAHDALARAAVDFKRGGTGKLGVSSEAALRNLGENALHHLGVHDESHTNAVHRAMLTASEDP